MKSLLYLLFIYCAITIVGCTGRSEYFEIAFKELKEGTTVKPGSYFVYQDSLSGIQDSFYCDYYRHGTYTTGHERGDELEINEYTIKDKDRHYLNFYAISNTMHCLIGTNTDPLQDTVYQFDAIRMPFQENKTDTTIDCVTTHVRYYPSLSIAGNVYNDVYEYSHAVSRSSAAGQTISASNHVTTYYSSQSGLVKYEVKSATLTQNWQLIRSNIIR